MRNAHDTIGRPADTRGRVLPTGRRAAARPAASAAMECGEAEFIICCFALCDCGGYDIVGGEFRIRGQA